MTNIELALALQQLSVHLQEQPEVELGGITIGNTYGTTSDQFKAIAKVMPKIPEPIKKRVGSDSLNWIWLEGKFNKIDLSFHIDRSKICRLVTPAQPAVYECEPLLSADEEAALTNDAEAIAAQEV